jgi:hypothetical protein
MKIPASLLISAFVVAGCSGGGGEPSEGNIREALEAQFESVYQTQVEMAGKEAAESARATLYDVKKIACVPATDAAGYQCDVEVDMEAPFLGRQKTNQSVRVVHGDDGWVAIQGR